MTKRIVIIGGGFAGLYASKAFANSDFHITIIDKRNFHLFQPLLYQVATGGLSPGDIASPLRAVFSAQKNVTVYCNLCVSIDPTNHRVVTDGPVFEYDYLIVATGMTHSYFGHEEWAEHAPGLKTVEDALEIRTRILRAFEKAESAQNQNDREKYLRFIIVGAGPSGVELAGALGELANRSMKNDFRNIDPGSAQIVLVEAADRILMPYREDLAGKAAKDLQRLGVQVMTSTRVLQISGESVSLLRDGVQTDYAAGTIIWAAGVQATGLSKMLSDISGVPLDKQGRVLVNRNLSLPGIPNIFIAGDLAHFEQTPGKPLPGVAPVAMQQGEFIAQMLMEHDADGDREFHYRDKGSLAVIGRNAAVAQFTRAHFSGFPAWLLWVIVHIGYLIEFDNKILVMMQWAWNYFTRKRGARLITQNEPHLTSEDAR